MITLFLARWLTPALGVLLALALAGVGIQSMRLDRLRATYSDALRVASEKARQREYEWGVIVREIDDARQTELRSIASERDAAIADSMRNRRARLPEAARAACQGSSGRELSANDAQFLIRLAGRADGLRAELAACYKREDALR